MTRRMTVLFTVCSLVMPAIGLFSQTASAQAPACVCNFVEESQVINDPAPATDAECVRACQDLAGQYGGLVNVEFDGQSVYTEAVQESIEREDERRAAQQQYAFFQSSNQCLCYCGTNQGAVSVGAAADYAACELACGESTVVSCATSLDNSPLGNPLCWSEEECLASRVEGEDPPVWGGTQPEECEAAFRYCYPPPLDLNLNVSIGGVETVNDVGAYVSLLYTYSIGAASIITIVMIMVGGVLWIIGSRGGNAEEVQKGKERIQNGVIGFVLILAAFTILNTINPATVRFKQISVPKIKPTLFVDGACEDFLRQGYSVVEDQEGQTACGDVGLVTKTPTGTDTTGTCTYKACPGNEMCGEVAAGHQCLSCALASGQAVKLGFQASAASCAALQPELDPTKDEFSYCLFSSDVDLGHQLHQKLGAAAFSFNPVEFVNDTYEAVLALVDVGVQAYSPTGTGGACGLVQISCAHIDTCDDYDNVPVLASGGSGSLTIVRLSQVEDWHVDICEGDPCKKIEGGCQANRIGSEAWDLGFGLNVCVPIIRDTDRPVDIPPREPPF